MNEKISKPQPENLEISRREQKEIEFKESVKAAEQLYNMSLIGDTNEAKINKLCETIGPLGPFRDRLIDYGADGPRERGNTKQDKASSLFFETIPILNKLAVIYKNFSDQQAKKRHVFINSSVSHLSNDAQFILYKGLSVIDESKLSDLNDSSAKVFLNQLKLF